MQRFYDLPRETRVPLLLMLLPVLCAGGASGAYYLRLHQICDAMTDTQMPRLPAPTATRRLLIVSPHCDDETLGVGGLIADARRAGTDVEVVFLTNGDGFPFAASRALREVKPSPTDLVHFAESRQQESLAASQKLGVPGTNVVFLGYPDQGLKPMWETYWNADHPFRSAFTGRTHSPYQRTLTPRATYCGASLVSDLTTVFNRFRPTDVLVTHPADDHPDHSTAAAFTQAALSQCQTSGREWSQRTRLHYFLVHRGDWPIPQGYFPDLALLPPPGMLRADTRWNLWKLSPQARAAKKAALDEYKSQTSVCGRFLNSFVRSTELVADLPADLAMPDPTTVIVSEGNAPPRFAIARDAIGDNVARYADRAVDLAALQIARDGDKLRIWVQARGAISGRVRYRVRLRVAADDVDRSHYLTLDVPSRPLTGNPRVAEVTVPMSEVLSAAPYGARNVRLWLSGETRWRAADVPTPVDCTGYRTFLLVLPPNAPSVAKNAPTTKSMSR